MQPAHYTQGPVHCIDAMVSAFRTKLIERGATALDNSTSSGFTSGEDLGKIIRAMKRLEARADEEDGGEPPPTLRKLSERELQQQRDAAHR